MPPKIIRLSCKIYFLKNSLHLLTIRLSRVGRKNLPQFKLIVQEKARPVKSGQYLEIVGHYDPRNQKNALTFKKERLEHFLKNGATPSDTAARLLKKAGVAGIEKFVRKYTKQRNRKAPAETPAAPTPAPASETPIAETPAA